MDLSNTNRGMKRSAGTFENEASTSKSKLINNIAIGATVNAQGNAIVCIDNINVHQNIHHQQPTPQQPPRAIDFQVADPITSYYGRDELFQHVKNAFNEPKNDKYNLVVACGYGGMGKTEFARKYIKNNRADFENTIWISAEFESTINDSFNKLLNELKGRGYRCYSHQDVYNYLNNNKTIFVFDNAENMKSIRSFLPIKSNDSLFLITSQVRTWIPYKSFELNKLDLKSAANIIKKVLATHKIEISDCQLQTFVNKIEPIPLVLQIEAGFVCYNVLKRKRIGKEYNMDNIIQTLTTKSEFVTQEFPDFSHDSYGKSVFAALSRTLDKIWGKQDKPSKLTTKILGLSAYLSADNIEQHTLKEILRIDDEELFEDSLFTLVEFSLFKISYNISIHRTVQECVQYYCRTKLNSYEYYSQALYLLLNDNEYWHHHNAVLQHHENSYMEIFLTFYGAKKCSTLDRNLGRSISYQLLKLVVAKLNFIINPEFLCEAIVRKQVDIEQLLLDNGADFNVVDNQGFNTLYYACLPRHDDEDCYYFNGTLTITWNRIQALIERGVDANSKNLKGNTIFHNLCNLGENCIKKDEYIFELCVLMIAVGGDPEIENEEGQKPADLARKYKLTRTLQLLDRSISEYKYNLHIAAELRQFEFLESLARDEVYDMNMRDDSGSTILHVLASLTQLDAKNEINFLYNTAELVSWYEANVSIKNNEMRTAADVALRCRREKLADFFSSQVQPGVILFKSTYRIKIEHFQFASTGDEKLVNEQDYNTRCTLLHALCGLDINNDSELELDIIKLVAHIVIKHCADVRLKNHEKETAAQVARRQGRLMLADFLDFRAGNCSVETVWRDDKWDKNKGDDFMYIAIKYYNFDLIKYTWWKYCFTNTGSSTEGFPDQSASIVVRMLCGYEDLSVTDATLIRVFDDLDLSLLAEYEADKYQAAIEIAKQHGRDELGVWMTRISVELD